METEIVHYQVGEDPATACNKAINALPPGETASNIGDNVVGCPACGRAKSDISRVSNCEHGTQCECFHRGYMNAWEHVWHDIAFAAEQDIEGCKCNLCQILDALKKTPRFQQPTDAS